MADDDSLERGMRRALALIALLFACTVPAAAVEVEAAAAPAPGPQPTAPPGPLTGAFVVISKRLANDARAISEDVAALGTLGTGGGPFVQAVPSG